MANYRLSRHRRNLARTPMNLTESQRRAYLDAMGIDVWVTRAPEHAEAAGKLPDVNAAELDWHQLRECVASCTQCELHRSRTQTVFGVGNPDASWLIVGEAPGAEEDRRGEPFVGRAGKLLDEMLRAVGQSRDSVFIANILKCRPPNNRDPKPQEAAACRGYLDRQIELIRPDIIIAVGRIAAHNLLGTDTPVGRLRGKRHAIGDLPLVVTYHPAYLLRSPSQKRKVWDDLCLARDIHRQIAA
jgi:DNA polymerase